jgi:hypothetical protein
VPNPVSYARATGWTTMRAGFMIELEKLRFSPARLSWGWY